MSDEKTQDKLAEEWEAALRDGDDSGPDLDAMAGDLDTEGASPDDQLAEEWAKALTMEEEDKVREETHSAVGPGPGQAEFKDLTAASKNPPELPKRDLDFILDIPLEVSAELGRTKLLINELLQLGQGSVIELNKLAGEPLEIYVNGKLVARGEAVVINEKFGVRLTDIISPIERVKTLG